MMQPQRLSRRFTWVTVVALLLAACASGPWGRSTSAEAYCDWSQPPSANSDAVVLELWANAARQRCWRAFAPVAASLTLTDPSVVVHPQILYQNSGPYTTALEAAAKAGTAPDIAFVFADDARRLIEQGYLVPIEDCPDYAERFGTVLSPFWQAVTWQGRRWGVPFDAEGHILYFNKPLLARLGWTPTAIEELPEHIRSGVFDLDDLADVGRDAVTAGIVPPGLAYVPRLSQTQALLAVYTAYGGRTYDRESQQFVVSRSPLVQTYAFYRRLLDEKIMLSNFGGDANTWGNRVVWRDAEANGRVLFWHGPRTDWIQWQLDHLDTHDDEAFLFDTIGYALFPSGRSGMAGRMLFPTSGIYIIFTPAASGRQNQEASCALLGATLAPDLAARHSLKSAELPTVSTVLSSPEFLANRFAKESAYMLDYVIGLPSLHPRYNQYTTQLKAFLARVEEGVMSPAEAADEAAHALERDLAGEVIVE